MSYPVNQTILGPMYDLAPASFYTVFESTYNQNDENFKAQIPELYKQYRRSSVPIVYTTDAINKETYLEFLKRLANNFMLDQRKYRILLDRVYRLVVNNHQNSEKKVYQPFSIHLLLRMGIIGKLEINGHKDIVEEYMNILLDAYFEDKLVDFSPTDVCTLEHHTGGRLAKLMQDKMKRRISQDGVFTKKNIIIFATLRADVIKLISNYQFENDEAKILAVYYHAKYIASWVDLSKRTDYDQRLTSLWYLCANIQLPIKEWFILLVSDLYEYNEHPQPLTLTLLRDYRILRALQVITKGRVDDLINKCSPDVKYRLFDTNRSNKRTLQFSPRERPFIDIATFNYKKLFKCDVDKTLDKELLLKFEYLFEKEVDSNLENLYRFYNLLLSYPNLPIQVKDDTIRSFMMENSSFDYLRENLTMFHIKIMGTLLNVSTDETIEFVERKFIAKTENPTLAKEILSRSSYRRMRLI